MGEPNACTIGFWKNRSDGKKGTLKWFPDTDFDDVVAQDTRHQQIWTDALAGADVAVCTVHPPRDGFREDEILEPEAARYLKTREIAVQDCENGNWAEGLQSLQAMAPPSENLSLDGAHVCAEMIAQRLKEES